MIARVLAPYLLPIAVAACIAALCGYVYWQLSRVGELEAVIENLEQSLSVKEEVNEVRTRPVPAVVSDILDRM